MNYSLGQNDAPPPVIYGEDIKPVDPEEERLIQAAVSKDPDEAMAARAALYRINVQSTADAKIASALKKQEKAQQKMMLLLGGGALAFILILLVLRR